MQEYAENFDAKNMDNQSKLQFSLLEMEQHNVLLISTAYKFMQLKKRNKQRKHHWWVHDLNRNRLQQGAYNLVWWGEIPTILQIDQRILNPAKLFWKHLLLTSYSGFPHPFFLQLSYESPHGFSFLHQYAAAGQIIQWRSVVCAKGGHFGVWPAILLFSCDFEVFLGNGSFYEWINFKVVLSSPVGKSAFSPVGGLNLPTLTKTHATPLKSYAASGYIWKCSRPLKCFSIFPVSAYHIYGILA